MRIAVLTGSGRGTAAHHLPYILQLPGIEIVQVIVSRGLLPNAKKSFQRKFKKALKIGLLGALNGVRMRTWYHNAELFLDIDNLEDICAASNIAFAMVDVTNSDETRELLKNANVDIALSLGNGFIAPSVFSIPRMGMLNIHHEELPAYQNAQSILWQLYNGNNKMGYTIHKIERLIDTGEILYQKLYQIDFKPTLAFTIAHNYALLWEYSAQGLADLLQNFKFYDQNKRPQVNGVKYTTPTIWQYLKIYRNYKKLSRQLR
jgi:methionyl-tRNA formyltransferase